MTLQEKADSLSVSPHTLRNWKRRQESVSSGSGDLTSRANKLNSHRLILPVELLSHPENAVRLTALSRRLKETGLSLSGALLYFALDYLRIKGIAPASFEGETGSLEKKVLESAAPDELKGMLRDFLETLPPSERIRPLGVRLFREEERCLQQEYDLPGLIYQSLRQEGKRSRHGSWFTPRPVVDALLRPRLKQHSRLFDPCCGSGLFLCRFAELKGSVATVRGVDRDPLAVFLARLNLYLRFPVPASLEAVSLGDSLSPGSWHLSSGTLTATNPPWGAHFSQTEKKALRSRYPRICSGESASYFLARTVEEMPPGAAAAFLLPEALFYVKAHRDIRKLLLSEAPPEEIREWGRLFKGVYSEVLSCRFIRKGKQRTVKVLPRGETLPLKRFRQENDKIINSHCSAVDQSIIDKIEKGTVRPLPGDCRWLLGVVTGDNGRFVQDSPSPGSLPLLTGKELKAFASDPVRRYLSGEISALQQSRKPEEYGEAKLVYRFIGHRPVFSLDREGLMTLNSANSLIPPEPGELKEMVFWYNSALFRFLWNKKYRSVKMLRHQLVSLPLPLWNKDEKRELTALVKEGEKRQDMPPEGDRLIFRHFDLTEREIRLVLEN